MRLITVSFESDIDRTLVDSEGSLIFSFVSQYEYQGSPFFNILNGVCDCGLGVTIEVIGLDNFFMFDGGYGIKPIGQAYYHRDEHNRRKKICQFIFHDKYLNINFCITTRSAFINSPPISK